MTDFNQHKPIYLQIADTICDKILSGEYVANERIPSVREMGISLGVNPNTIMRSYEHLQINEIIFNTRGIGYFVSDNAEVKILEIQRTIFIKEELPNILKRMRLLNFSADEVCMKLKEI